MIGLKYNTNGSIFYTPPENGDQEFYSYVVDAYGFILNTKKRRNKHFSWSDFGRMIADNYSLKDEKNHYVVSTLRSEYKTVTIEYMGKLETVNGRVGDYPYECIARDKFPADHVYYFENGSWCHESDLTLLENGNYKL